MHVLIVCIQINESTSVWKEQTNAIHWNYAFEVKQTVYKRFQYNVFIEYSLVRR